MERKNTSHNLSLSSFKEVFLMGDSLFSEKWPLLSSYDRRRFLKQATAFGVSSTAFAAFLEACGSGGASSTTTANTANLAGPIDLQALTTSAKKEGKLEAIGIPP